MPAKTEVTSAGGAKWKLGRLLGPPRGGGQPPDPAWAGRGRARRLHEGQGRLARSPCPVAPRDSCFRPTPAREGGAEPRPRGARRVDDDDFHGTAGVALRLALARTWGIRSGPSRASPTSGRSWTCPCRASMSRSACCGGSPAPGTPRHSSVRPRLRPGQPCTCESTQGFGSGAAGHEGGAVPKGDGQRRFVVGRRCTPARGSRCASDGSAGSVRDRGAPEARPGSTCIRYTPSAASHLRVVALGLDSPDGRNRDGDDAIALAREEADQRSGLERRPGPLGIRNSRRGRSGRRRRASVVANGRGRTASPGSRWRRARKRRWRSDHTRW